MLHAQNDENIFPRRSISPAGHRYHNGPRMDYWLRRSNYHPALGGSMSPIIHRSASPTPSRSPSPFLPFPGTVGFFGGTSADNPIELDSANWPAQTYRPGTSLGTSRSHREAGTPPPPYVAPPPATGSAPPGNTPSVAGAVGIHAADVLVKIQVPLGSDVIGTQPTLATITISSSTSFGHGFTRICERMGLETSNANLGYKLTPGEVARDPPHALGTADDWSLAIQDAVGKQNRARTRPVFIRIYNLSQASVAPGSSQVARGRKRKEPDAQTDSVGTKELRLLKQHMDCSVHKGRYCFIGGDGHHHQLDIYHLTLWSKEMVHDRATLTRPPENIVFQKLFLTKRRRTSNGGSALSPIYGHDNIPSEGSSQPVANIPSPIPISTPAPPANSSFSAFETRYSAHDFALPNEKQQEDRSTASSFPNEKAIVPEVTHAGGLPPDVSSTSANASAIDTSFTVSEDMWPALLYDDSPPVTYPDVLLVLQHQHTMFPFVNQLQCYASLCVYGCQYVNNVAFLDRSFFTDVIGMHSSMVDEFISLSEQATRKAEAVAHTQE